MAGWSYADSRTGHLHTGGKTKKVTLERAKVFNSKAGKKREAKRRENYQARAGQGTTGQGHARKTKKGEGEQAGMGRNIVILIRTPHL
jgi:hypothetical protein